MLKSPTAPFHFQDYCAVGLAAAAALSVQVVARCVVAVGVAAHALGLAAVVFVDQ